MRSLAIRILGATFGLALASPAVAAATPTIDSSPPPATNNGDAIFQFSDHSNPSATFVCRLDGIGDFTSCTSPKAYPGLTEGAHTFSVEETGGIVPSPVTYNWTVDFTPPNTVLDSAPPALTNQPSATFTFHSSDATATFQCSLNLGPFSACTSPKQYNGLGDGSRQFVVRAVDPAGNVDPSPPGTSWTVDTTPPDTTIASGPTGYDKHSSPAFTFTSSKPNSTFQCALDGGSFAPCGANYTLPATADGQHTLAVRATDGAGNTDPSPASRTWTVDVNGPAAPVLTLTHNPGQRLRLPPGVHRRAADGARTASAGPAGPGSGSEPFLTTPLVLVKWHPAGASTVGVKVTEGSPDGPLLSSAPSGQLGRTIPYGAQTCYVAVAVDAGGVSSKPNIQCVAVPYPASGLQGDYLAGSSEGDDGSNARNSVLVHDGNAFGGSYLRLGAGQSLSYSLAYCSWGCAFTTARLVVLVATTCSTCGSISIEVDSLSHPDGTGPHLTFTRTLNLHSNQLHNKQLFLTAIPLKNSQLEWQLKITRLTGTPRIEGLWM